MGQYLKRIEDNTNDAIRQAENQLAELSKSKEWQLAKNTADLAGIVDPTPVSDSISMGMSIAEGDWLGAFRSGVSYIPWFGDVVAEPVKILRATKTIACIEKQAAALAKQIAHFKSAANQIAQRKMAAAAERARRAKEAAEKYAKAKKCSPCQKLANNFGTQLPTTGKWSGEKGNSKWTSDGPDPVTIEYRKGYPDFTTSQPPSIYPEGGGSVEIIMNGDKTDFGAAYPAMREKLQDPTWPGIRANQPKGYTWHHSEDGATMVLVKSDIHDKQISGIAHVGGESITAGKDNYKNSTQF